MPAAYDTTSRRFDDLMAEVCPHGREETRQRIEEISERWKAACLMLDISPLRIEAPAAMFRENWDR